jgi:hypothetical protein
VAGAFGCDPSKRASQSGNFARERAALSSGFDNFARVSVAAVAHERKQKTVNHARFVVDLRFPVHVNSISNVSIQSK